MHADKPEARAVRASDPPRDGTGAARLTDLHFPGADLTIRLVDADRLRCGLSSVVKGWRPEIRPTPASGAHAKRLSRVAVRRDGFTAASPFYEDELSGLGLAEACCAVLSDLTESWIDANPGSFALHCGAFRFQGGLVMLTGPRRAGKSTLIARLGAEVDATIFCDDVLPLTPSGLAVGLGIAPRIRLPMPRRSHPDFLRHVRKTPGARDRCYAYLRSDNLAPHGTMAEPSTLIVLDRRANGAARLHRMAQDQALHHLLAQNMAHLGDAEAAFAGARCLLGRLTVLRMVYSDLEEAVALLRRNFATDAPDECEPEPGPELHVPLTPPPPERPARPFDPDRVWKQRPNVMLRQVEGSAFLWTRGGKTVWHLNPVGHVIWSALEIPGDVTELAELLADLYPDVPRATLLSDTWCLLAELAEAGFVVAADG
ncbi:PqqD family protein [Paracoccus sp. EGI L200073]|nr:PqqD family protein [Paracoccus salsus]